MTGPAVSRAPRLFILPIAAWIAGVAVGAGAATAVRVVMAATADEEISPAALDPVGLGRTVGVAFGVLTFVAALLWFANAVFPRGRRSGAAVLALAAAGATAAALVTLAAAVGGGVSLGWTALGVVLVPSAAGAAFVQWDRGTPARPGTTPVPAAPDPEARRSVDADADAGPAVDPGPDADHEPAVDPALRPDPSAQRLHGDHPEETSR